MNFLHTLHLVLLLRSLFFVQNVNFPEVTFSWVAPSVCDVKIYDLPVHRNNTEKIHLDTLLWGTTVTLNCHKYVHM